MTTTAEAATPLAVESEENVVKKLDLVPLKGTIGELDKKIDPAVETLAKTADPELLQQADKFIDMLLGEQFDTGQKRLAVDQLGLRSQEEAAHRSAMLKEPMRTLYQKTQKGEGKTVGDGLVDLKQRMLELDPVKFGLSVKNIQTMLGKTKIGKAIDKYWTKAQSMETVIDTIVKSIDEGAQRLQRDNETYADDQDAMRQATKKLKKIIQVAILIDAGLQKKLDSNAITDPEQVKFVQQELLFPVRKRIMSLQQTLLANQQAIMTSEIMINTNRELIRGTYDTKNISVVQLQNVLSLIVGLFHQRDQLSKLTELNKTTEHFMSFGAELLDNQATDVNKLASDVMISIETLEKCMANIHSAFDKIDTFRRESLPRMAESVIKMDRMIEFNEKEMQKREKGKAARAQMVIDVV